MYGLHAPQNRASTKFQVAQTSFNNLKNVIQVRFELTPPKRLDPKSSALTTPPLYPERLAAHYDWLKSKILYKKIT